MRQIFAIKKIRGIAKNPRKKPPGLLAVEEAEVLARPSDFDFC